jgi:GMP synthase (glutamine-hydrolysing)
MSFCEIYPYNKMPDHSDDIKAVVLSGSPFSVLDENALQIDLDALRNKYPILAVCYGAQYTAQFYGGKVMKSEKREYGKAVLSMVQKEDPIFKGISSDSQIWMSHGDTILSLPEGAEVIAKTADIDVAAYKLEGEQPYYCFQFHPEVTHSLEGKELLSNFVIDIAGCHATYTPASFVEQSVKELKEKIGDSKVVMGLSGGRRFHGRRHVTTSGYWQKPVLYIY